ncbi:ras and Rab interactor 3-like [Paralichthys olivaceus]|uniref:ras and Rab interactor 3-like n=1 Tax=Paralichthys olivaceus TaxID=8255 RepID=UPI00097D57BE|nr:PREDICTED: ras and Rab interactor 3-like [Paralichthys olivaceus]
MAQQDEPLYDFPEPTQSAERKFSGHQRGQGSLRSVSVLDRLLLTVPVWLQLSINPANALHILQREPPGTFLVRRSRTSQRNVLCMRLVDDSVPSFVRQFGIREEQSTLSLETSAISFPDLPRLISFYCVSRDVLPFPLELPEAIAKATSHKELESISHMGIEFWSSHLNVRGPREAPKEQKDKKQKPDPATPAPPAAPPQTGSKSTPQPDSDHQTNTVPEPGAATNKSAPNPTLFHEFCPIMTRSPRELDCGYGLGALCFINPLFLQSQSALSRRRMLKRSLKVRISMETSTLLSPPLVSPPPPPLMPKSKGRCKAQKKKQGVGGHQLSKSLSQGGNPSQAITQRDPTAQVTQPLTQTQEGPSEAQTQPPSAAPHSQQEEQEQGETKARFETAEAAQLPTVMEHLEEESDYMQPSPMINVSHPLSLSHYLSASMAPPLFLKLSQSLSPHSQLEEQEQGETKAQFETSEAAQLPTVMEHLEEESDYMQPSPMINFSHPPSLSPYLSASMAPPLFLKLSQSLSPHSSPGMSPSLSPYQSPTISPKAPFSLSPCDSPCASPSLSPYQSPSLSPKVAFPLSPFTSSPLSQRTEEVYHTPTATALRPSQQRSEPDTEEEGSATDGNKEDKDETNEELHEKEEEEGLVLQMNAASLNDTDSCSSFSSLEGAAETPTHSLHDQNSVNL